MNIIAIRPNETPAPNHIRAIAAGANGSGGAAVEGLPKSIDTAISAIAINAAGNSPAANRPPIERLATNPRMIRLMQGGMVSAITAEAASNATVEPGFWPDLRETGISTAPPAATSAIFEPEMPENSTMALTITTFR